MEGKRTEEEVIKMAEASLNETPVRKAVTQLIDWSEAMKEERLSTLLDMLVGCINKLEVLKKRTRSLLKRLQV